jgi:hypothetical protein
MQEKIPLLPQYRSDVNGLIKDLKQGLSGFSGPGHKTILEYFLAG